MIAEFDAYQYGTFSLSMTLEQAKCASHPGRCDDDVAYVAALPAVTRQRRKLNPAAIARVLEDYTDWDTSDADQNWQRLVWIAAGQIVDDNR